MDEQPTVDSGANNSDGGKASFIQELKRRKVFRVGITYAAVSWLIIQVASTTFEGFGIPLWAFRFVVLMVALGFPVAVLLAWAFEVTPDGVRKTRVANSEGSDKQDASFNNKKNIYAIGLAAALPTLIFGTLAVIFYFGPSSGSQGTPDPAEKASEERPYRIGRVAVLPFTLFSEDATMQSTADGLQDEMLTVLSEMDPLDVVSRTSTLQFASNSKSIPEIGKIIGADFIIEGSIQGVGSKLRVTVQLIEASTDKHIWAETFDRAPEKKDAPLLFQKELAYELAIRTYQVLEETFPASGNSKVIRDKIIEDLEQQLRLNYDAFWVNFHDPDWLAKYQRVLAQIDEIMSLDPDNFYAHECKAGILSFSSNVGLSDYYDLESQNDYYLVLKRAYAVAPNGFDTNKHLGLYYYGIENNPQKALPYCWRAVDLDREYRGSVNIYTYLALLNSLCSTGQGAAAVRVMEEATSKGLASFSGPAWFWTWAYRIQRDIDKSIDFLEENLDIAQKEDDPLGKVIYGSQLAFAHAVWSGSKQPLIKYMEAALEAEDLAVRQRHRLGGVAFFVGNYELMLDLLGEIVDGNSVGSFSEIDMAGARAWAYLKTGNLALARSYFKGYIEQLEVSTKGQWMKRYRPDVHDALLAYGNACLGNHEEALLWSEKALEKSNPSRHFADYFETMHQMAITYTLLGEHEKASEMVDLLLSSPSGYSTGRILIHPQLDDLHDSPFFEEVIRKHADQLKDPAVLTEFFGE